MAPAYNATGYQPNTEIISDELSDITSQIHYQRPRTESEKQMASFGPKNLPPGALPERVMNQLNAFHRHFGSSIPKIMLIHLEMLYFRQDDLENLSDHLEKEIGTRLSVEFLDALKKSVTDLEDTPLDPVAFIVEIFNKHYDSIVMQQSFKRILEYIYEERKKAMTSVDSSRLYDNGPRKQY